jgi:hypothetical protein
MALLLWIIAVVLVVWGIVTILRGAVLYGVLLIILGLLVGPGGVSLFDFDDDDGEDLAPVSQEVT